MKKRHSMGEDIKMKVAEIDIRKNDREIETEMIYTRKEKGE